VRHKLKGKCACCLYGQQPRGPSRTVTEEKCQVLQEVEDEPFSKHAIIEDPNGHLVSLAELKSKGEEEA
jgi:hypothetical protein